MILVLSTVEAKPGEEAQLAERFKDYTALVHANEPGTLFFDIYEKSFDADAGTYTFIYLEGFADEAAQAEHDAQDYKAAHVAKMRTHIKTASAKRFVEKPWG